MSDLPSTKRELLRFYYKFLSNAKCKSCSAPIEWWETTNGRKMPFNPMPDDNAAAVTHFITCPNADQHRKPKGAQEQKPKELPGKKLEYPRRLELLREYSDAKGIFAIWADGTSFATTRAGLDPEETRHDLITLANNTRNHLRAEKETRA